MTITQACGYVTTDARKVAVQQTIDRTGRRQAIEATIDKLRQNHDHAWLQKIRTDRGRDKDRLLEETLRDIAIRQQYDTDQPFANQVNRDLGLT
jgi:hypothetical protein